MMPRRQEGSEPVQKKKAWMIPQLCFDGELRDFVQSSNKPPTATGEAGDPGHRPTSQ